MVFDISTHTPLAGRDAQIDKKITPRFVISTHTPLAGRDYNLINTSGEVNEISTHTPLAGRDTPWKALHYLLPYFNSHAPRGA